VDDDPDIAEYFSLVLEDNGYDVQTASSEASALRTMEQFRPNAMLIDVMMPGRSGLDLMVKLRQSPAWKDLPVIIITGDDTVIQDECRSYFLSYDGVRGPDEVLGKPVDRDRLLEILAALC